MLWSSLEAVYMIDMRCCGSNRWKGGYLRVCLLVNSFYHYSLTSSDYFFFRRRQLAQLGSATGVYKTLVKYLVGVPQVCIICFCFLGFTPLIFGGWNQQKSIYQRRHFQVYQRRFRVAENGRLANEYVFNLPALRKMPQITYSSSTFF